MSKSMPPSPPTTLPEQQAVYRDSKYQRRRNPFSLWALVIGLLIGLAGGGYYAYVINPTQELDTHPSQLISEDQQDYVVAIMLAYSYDSDLNTAIDRLLALELGSDPLQAVADMTCDLARTGYVDSTSGLRAVRAMRTFYQLQGRTSCADNIIPAPESVPLEVVITLPTATPTLPPPPTKTPNSVVGATETPSGVIVTPTSAPQGTYRGVVSQTFCSTELSGVIEVRVRDALNVEIAGEPIRVTWGNNERSDFITGLKPERGVGYADFQMETGVSYIISMPGLSDPIQSPIVASSCFVPDTNLQAITSYRIVFVLN